MELWLNICKLDIQPSNNIQQSHVAITHTESDQLCANHCLNKYLPIFRRSTHNKCGSATLDYVTSKLVNSHKFSINWRQTASNCWAVIWGSQEHWNQIFTFGQYTRFLNICTEVTMSNKYTDMTEPCGNALLTRQTWALAVTSSFSWLVRQSVTSVDSFSHGSDRPGLPATHQRRLLTAALIMHCYGTTSSIHNADYFACQPDISGSLDRC